MKSETKSNLIESVTFGLIIASFGSAVTQLIAMYF